MRSNTPIANSGKDSRPTVVGGVDNMGVADKRKDRASVKQDDSAPLDLTEGTEEDASDTEPAGRKPFLS